MCNETKLKKLSREDVITRIEAGKKNNERVYMWNVDLCGECLDDLDLMGAVIGNSNLSHTSLEGTNLAFAVIYDSDFNAAKISYARMDEAQITQVDFSNAEIRSSSFYGATLDRVNFDGAFISSSVGFLNMRCPEEGSFIAWKKVWHDDAYEFTSATLCSENAHFLVAKLLIPEDALRSSATTNKCRASKAVVLELQNLDGTPSNLTKAHAFYDLEFVYEVGKTVEVKDFDTYRWKECAAGIHFFVTRNEAVNHST